MFDTRGERLGALIARLPDLVVVLLLATADLTASVTGYALGLGGERHPVPSAVFVLTAVVLYIILDIDRHPGHRSAATWASADARDRTGRAGGRIGATP